MRPRERVSGLGPRNTQCTHTYAACSHTQTHACIQHMQTIVSRTVCHTTTHYIILLLFIEFNLQDSTRSRSFILFAFILFVGVLLRFPSFFFFFFARFGFGFLSHLDCFKKKLLLHAITHTLFFSFSLQ